MIDRAVAFHQECNGERKKENDLKYPVSRFHKVNVLKLKVIDFGNRY